MCTDANTPAHLPTTIHFTALCANENISLPYKLLYMQRAPFQQQPRFFRISGSVDQLVSNCNLKRWSHRLFSVRLQVQQQSCLNIMMYLDPSRYCQHCSPFFNNNTYYFLSSHATNKLILWPWRRFNSYLLIKKIVQMTFATQAVPLERRYRG